jgi:hypothetical protein
MQFLLLISLVTLDYFLLNINQICLIALLNLNA